MNKIEPMHLMPDSYFAIMLIIAMAFAAWLFCQNAKENVLSEKRDKELEDDLRYRKEVMEKTMKIMREVRGEVVNPKRENLPHTDFDD